MKQIYPASITSKSFAAGGSVLDHKFGRSEPYTLGVDPTSGRLYIASVNTGVLQIVDVP